MWFLNAFNPVEWFHLAFAGLWNEVWKYGTGVAILALSGAVIVFNPLGLRQAALGVFFITALVLAVYSWGAKDGDSRCLAQRAIVERDFLIQLHKQYIFTPRPKPKPVYRSWF